MHDEQFGLLLDFVLAVGRLLLAFLFPGWELFKLDILALALFQVELEHVEHRLLDVLGPRLVLLVEADALNETIDVVEGAWELQKAGFFRFDLVFLEHFHGLDLFWLLDLEICLYRMSCAYILLPLGWWYQR